MTDFATLVKTTNAYNVIKNDIANDRLSHAYLVICPDQANLDGYMRFFAKQLLCEQKAPCGKCRHCGLIENDVHSDVYFYPKEAKGYSVEQITEMISESFYRPVESDKKVFVLSQAQDMNAICQNKLLKTLEEPPKNVHILIGATGEQSLLPTLKSRVKILRMQGFSNQTLLQALKDDCPDQQRLFQAVACGDGTLGRAVELYNDQSFNQTVDLAKDILVKMQSSKQVLEFSALVTKSKVDFLKLITVLELLLRDMLLDCCGQTELVSNSLTLSQTKNAQGFTKGAIISIIEDLAQARQRKRFNANQNMLTEWLLFKILEEKFKWQKL